MNTFRPPRLLAVLALGLSARAPAQTGPGDAPAVPADRSKFHLYLLIGQSNMAGRGKVEKEDRTPHPRVLSLNKDGQWIPAVDPLHFDKPTAGVGPGLAFGKAMAEADKDAVIGLIPCAAGGSPLRVWKKGETWEGTKSKPYDDTLRRVASAVQKGVLKGILWHQGESDSNDVSAKNYGERLAEFVNRLRRDLQAPETPFLAGGMSDALCARDADARIVDQALRGLPQSVPHAAFVGAEKLTMMSDKLHFDAAGAREFGRRYAKAMLQALKK